jgi:3-hydroxybutyryl-CoA dehydrogenase
VDVVKGERTSDATVATMRDMLLRADKQPVVVQKDVPGQLGNRLQHALYREAFHIIQEGIASVEDIDTAIKQGPGLRWPVYGLLEHADVAGLDMVFAIDSYLFRALSTMQEPPALLHRLVEQGNLGVKTGRGLYDWSRRSAPELIARRDRFLIERLREARQQAQQAQQVTD